MMSAPKITFIGAGSTIFVKNILGDVFHREALKTAHIALMDIDPTRLEEGENRAPTRSHPPSLLP